MPTKTTITRQKLSGCLYFLAIVLTSNSNTWANLSNSATSQFNQRADIGKTLSAEEKTTSIVTHVVLTDPRENNKAICKVNAAENPYLVPASLGYVAANKKTAEQFETGNQELNSLRNCTDNELNNLTAVSENILPLNEAKLAVTGVDDAALIAVGCGIPFIGGIFSGVADAEVARIRNRDQEFDSVHMVNVGAGAGLTAGAIASSTAGGINIMTMTGGGIMGIACSVAGIYVGKIADYGFWGIAYMIVPPTPIKNLDVPDNY